MRWWVPGLVGALLTYFASGMGAELLASQPILSWPFALASVLAEAEAVLILLGGVAWEIAVRLRGGRTASATSRGSRV